MPEIHFGEQVAAGYDASDSDEFDPAVIEATVAFLARLAGDGPALELAIGTGRIAVPLRHAGIRVSGVDLSPFMVEQLRAKDGADSIDVVTGDMCTARVEGAGGFRLAYLVFNTICNLTTQDAQVECFVNAAAHLEPGGCFVIEVGVPDLQRLPPGETVQAFSVEPTHLGFDEYHDLAAQTFSSHHYFVRDGTCTYFSMPFRYVWPSELDLMAQLAGMRLQERWADWDRSTFTGESRKHVSVWRKEE
jgi:SAM-dependent methyltransferase